MKTPSDTSSRHHTRPLLILLCACFTATSISKAANVYLTASDSEASPAFTTTSTWSNGEAPSASHDYFINGNLFGSTPNTPNTSYIFAGKSLTISNGAQFVVRGWNNTITVSNLILSAGGSIRNWAGSSGPTFVGSITVEGSGSIFANVKVSASIGGNGQLLIERGTVILSGQNTFSGGTVLKSHASGNAILDAQHDGALGTGNVTLEAGTTLKLGGGITHNYINDAAALILNSGATANSVTLSFVGTDAIGALSFDGGNTWASEGTWGAIGSGARYTSSLFSGSGILQVGPAIPEPSTTTLWVSGIVLYAITFIRCLCRRHRP